MTENDLIQIAMNAGAVSAQVVVQPKLHTLDLIADFPSTTRNVYKEMKDQVDQICPAWLNVRILVNMTLPASAFSWGVQAVAPPKPRALKYPQECPCGIYARRCEYHDELRVGS